MHDLAPMTRFAGRLTAVAVFGAMLMLFPQSARSLDPKRAITQYVHDTWTTDNGLPQNTVESIIQSRDGYLWLGTQEGLVRFDGLHFTIYDRTTFPELMANSVLQIVEDGSGALWYRFQGPFGVARLIPRDSTGSASFHLFTAQDGLPTNQVNELHVDRPGTVWIATDKGLVHYSDGKFVTLTEREGLPSDTVFGILRDTVEGIFVATPRGGARLLNGQITTFSAKSGLHSDTITAARTLRNGDFWVAAAGGINRLRDGRVELFTARNGIPHTQVDGITEDSRGNVFFAARDGLYLFRDSSFTAFRYPADRRGETFVNRFYEDHSGNLWIHTFNRGLMRFSLERAVSGREGFEVFDKENGLIADDVRSLCEDNEGSLWIGTYGGGLHRLRDGKFVITSAQDGLTSDLINSIFQDRSGRFWAGTFDHGISQFSGGTVRSWTTKDGLANDNVQSVFEDRDGVMWFGTNDGLSRFKDGVFTTFRARDGLPGNNIAHILQDSSGDLWFATRSGLGRLHEGKFIKYGVKDGLATDLAFSLYLDARQNLWIGTALGLTEYANGTFTNFITAGGGFINSVFDIGGDPDGTIWLATAGRGIGRWKDGKCTFITPKEGLFDYNAYVILQDDLGNIWTDCNKGIYSVRKQELIDVAEGRRTSVSCTAYGTADGMRNRECNGGNQPAGWKASDGTLCFCTVKGVAMIDPKSIRLNTVPPPVVIEQALADGTPMNPALRAELSPGTGKLEFHFAGLSFVGAEKIIYRYKLDGFDKTWVEAGGRRDAYYTNIPHGDYSFRVIARNNDGVWNETGASIAMTIRPFFYETGWFYALCVFGFVGIGPSIYTFRVRQMKRREIELMSIVRERTKELQHEKERSEEAFIEAEKHRSEAVMALKELKETQHQLVLSEKMASLGQLTAGIAHEIKNPLNFVNNFAVLSSDLSKELREEILRQKANIDPGNLSAIEELLNDLEQNVTKINEHGRRADSIVKGMLLHSRGKSGERQPTDVNALLAEYVNLAYHGLRAQDQSFNIKIETKFDPSVGIVSVVPQNLSRVFLNIVNNGCYAANEKKKTRGPDFMPTISVSTKNLGEKIEVRIRDNGNGIPASVLDKIFNPFFTTKPTGAGTGLGLSLSYDIIVEEHKGEIRVDTREGEYAEFIILLPKQIS